MIGGVYIVGRADTPRRDVDLFGPTTVRIDYRAAEGASPVPLLYLSAYVEDPVALTRRIIGALSWLDDTQTVQAVQDPRPAAPVAPAPAPTYAMPNFVEDVDYDERLLVAEDPTQTDWKAWAAAMVRRVKLATTAGQLAALETANAVGMKLCPWRLGGDVVKALRDAYEVTMSCSTGWAKSRSGRCSARTPTRPPPPTSKLISPLPPLLIGGIGVERFGSLRADALRTRCR